MGKTSLKEYLDSNKCFKLICGAGNKDFQEITELCTLFAQSGCRFFDVNASVEAVKAAKKGIELAGKQEECFICVSVGTKNDPHTLKYIKNKNNCIKCSKCEEVCERKAINNPDRCIGCAKCFKVCENNAIEIVNQEIPFEELLPPLIKEGIDCIEFHAITDNEDEIKHKWQVITDLYDGALSVCIDRSKFGDEKLISILRYMKENCTNLFIIQADGAPMSGGKDEYRTTLQAVAAADIIDKAKITDYIFMSGGTNSKTIELAKLCGINTTGVAMGSYARKIAKQNPELIKKILVI